MHFELEYENLNFRFIEPKEHILCVTTVFILCSRIKSKLLCNEPFVFIAFRFKLEQKQERSDHEWIVKRRPLLSRTSLCQCKRTKSRANLSTRMNASSNEATKRWLKCFCNDRVACPQVDATRGGGDEGRYCLTDSVCLAKRYERPDGQRFTRYLCDERLMNSIEEMIGRTKQSVFLDSCYSRLNSTLRCRGVQSVA